MIILMIIIVMIMILMNEKNEKIYGNKNMVMMAVILSVQYINIFFQITKKIISPFIIVPIKNNNK